MKIFSSHSLTLVFATFLLCGCARKEPEQAPPAQSPQTAARQTQPAPTTGEPAPAKKTSPAPASPPAASTAKAPAAQAAPAAPATTTPETAVPSPPPRDAAPAKPAEKPPTLPKQAVPAAQPTKVTLKDVVILKAPLGGVRFQHKIHAETRTVACETCHHPSRAEKPATPPQQACSTCHTSTATPPMKTKLQAAFHNPVATAGTCIDCHKAQNAKGRAAPVKCLDCHKKENS